MQRVMPGAKFFDLDASHPLFHTFFEVNDLDIIPQAYIAGRPIFRGLFEDNDPTKRLQMIVNYNTDVSQFWEWSGTGLRPIERHERGVQARRELHHLRADALSRRRRRSPLTFGTKRLKKLSSFHAGRVGRFATASSSAT